MQCASRYSDRLRNRVYGAPPGAGQGDDLLVDLRRHVERTGSEARFDKVLGILSELGVGIRTPSVGFWSISEVDERLLLTPMSVARSSFDGRFAAFTDHFGIAHALRRQERAW